MAWWVLRLSHGGIGVLALFGKGMGKSSENVLSKSRHPGKIRGQRPLVEGHKPPYVVHPVSSQCFPKYAPRVSQDALKQKNLV